jgi:hypothetical protein
MECLLVASGVALVIGFCVRVLYIAPGFLDTTCAWLRGSAPAAARARVRTGSVCEKIA